MPSTYLHKYLEKKRGSNPETPLGAHGSLPQSLLQRSPQPDATQTHHLIFPRVSPEVHPLHEHPLGSFEQCDESLQLLSEVAGLEHLLDLLDRYSCLERMVERLERHDDHVVPPFLQKIRDVRVIGEHLKRLPDQRVELGHDLPFGLLCLLAIFRFRVGHFMFHFVLDVRIRDYSIIVMRKEQEINHKECRWI